MSRRGEIVRGYRLKTFSQTNESTERYVNPKDIILPPGYRAEVYAQGLDCPIGIVFSDDGDLYVAESGLISGNPRVLVQHNNQFDVVADNFYLTIYGINYHNGSIFVSQKGIITELKPDGTKNDILSGLPSNGDHGNSRVVFGTDGKMYFGQGTVTNSGVVGLDNTWCKRYPYLNDYPGSYIMLNGINFRTENIFVDPSVKEEVYTGAYSPFGIPNLPFETRKGITKASGSILRANPDGSNLELVAWGLRNPAYLRYDLSGRLYAANHGFEIRGSRPIANSPDEFQVIIPGAWYGWPDFTGGEPVTLSRFKPEGKPQPEFLLSNHPAVPPRPFAIFPQASNIMGFDFNNNSDFGEVGDVYISEFGSLGPRISSDLVPYVGIGHRISKIDIASGGVTTFAINRSGFPTSVTEEGGFGWPTDVVFGPDHAMYIVDFGSNPSDAPFNFLPNTGIIWKITRIH